MDKQVLLDKANSYITCVKSFFDEYRDEWVYEKEDRLMNLLNDVVNDIHDNAIPYYLYERIAKLLDTLAIEELRINLHNCRNIHDLNLYKQLSDNIIVNSLFVGKTYYLLKAIGFINSNVVLIGANGCGKTTFANSIRESLEKTDNGIVIPAQKLLIFPTYDFVPTYKSAYTTYQSRQKEVLDDKQTFSASKPDDFPYELMRKYGAEMRALVSTLLGERIARRDEYCSIIHDGDKVNTSKFRSKLDDIIDIWNSLIEHRVLFCDNSGNLKIKYNIDNEIKEYPAFRMSDGEREIFYVVGRILLAKDHSLVVIDEPELHLHKAILNKLWDMLETKRNDCMFIYLTHDIDFASSRIAKKCWLKSYTYDTMEDWEIEPITNDEIPEALLMKLLGSRKKILFCEGKKNSLDNQIYELLFPNYTIIPVASCKDVINYTRAFNKIESKYAKAFGIIDRDFRKQEQIDKLITDSIYSYNVAEIENLFLIEEFIKGFADYKNEPCEISKIKDDIMELFKKNVQQQASYYVTQKINYYFREYQVKRGKSVDEVEKAFTSLTSDIQIREWFDKREQELNEIIDRNDYSEAILAYNNKGLHSIIEKTFGISSYNKKALEYLKASEDAKQLLRKMFPDIL